jgi:hypothetical protein
MENLKISKNPSRLIGCLALYGVFYLCSGFTVLSGPEKATIRPNNGSTNDPQVIFHWDGSVPQIHSAEGFLDGKHAGKSGTALMRAIIEESLSIWSSIPGTAISLVLDDQIDNGAQKDRLDLKHSIFAEDITSSSFAAAALPNFAYNKEINPNRDIVDCDIQIGTSTYSAEELAFTVAHEIGHCLGIGHNHLVGDAMMSYRNTDRKFTLSADDIMAAMFLYPSERYADTPKDFLGCGIVGTNLTSPVDPVPLVLWLFFPLFCLLLRCRRTSDS